MSDFVVSVCHCKIDLLFRLYGGMINLVFAGRDARSDPAAKLSGHEKSQVIS